MQLKHSHSICLIRSDDSGQANAGLYGNVGAYLAKGYAVVYAVETTTADTILRMNNSGIRAGKYIESNALTILDRNFIYSKERTRLEGRLLLETWKEIISKVSQSGKFKGIAAMGMPEPFFETTTNHQKLVEYEQLVSREFDGSFEAVCCYRQESVADLPLRHLISLLNSHQYAVTGVEKYSEWHAAKLFVMIVKGLEKTVGAATAKLMFESMKSVYKIDEQVIISRPEIFENALGKMFADSADAILDAIKREMIAAVLMGYSPPESHGIEQPISASAGPVFLLCPSCYWSATTILNWKPDFCPVCHNSAIRSIQLTK